VALGVLAGQHGAKGEFALPALLAALIVGALAGWLHPGIGVIDLVNVVSMLVLGALVAAELPMPLAAYVALGAVLGLTHGYANGGALVPPIRPLPFVSAVGLAGFLAAICGFALADSLVRRGIPWLRIAVRVAGSWVAAIGILVLATSWKRLAA
jgi:urease accessory protein